MNRDQQQIAFILEIDRLKTIFRRSYLTDCSRFENDAEHSWYFALIALVLREHAPHDVDIFRVMKMALIHDIVEIDAGDVILYDEEARKNQVAKEEAAAERIFGILPPDQGVELFSLWREFEEGATVDARYARAVDRFSSIILNYATGGRSWMEHGITISQVKRANREVIEGASHCMWQIVEKMIDETFQRKNSK